MDGEKRVFTREKSLIIKGVAILMMIWHHCFLAGRYEGYSISFWPLAEYQVTNIASFCKICVSLFAFVSGYGMYKSYDKEDLKNNNKWIKNRLIRTMSGYWFVVILAWIVTVVIDQRPVSVYGYDQSILAGCWYAFIDFLGLGNFFRIYLFNEDWWYMSAAVVYVVLSPMFYKLLKKLGGLQTLGIIFIGPRIWGEYPGVVHFMSFMPAFVLGMFFAQNNVFEKWHLFWEQKISKKSVWFIKLCLMLLMVFVSYKLYYYLPTDKFWDVKWGIIPLVIIVFVNDYLAQIQLMKRVLMFLGKHSANIFWTHTFFRLYYCKDIIYGMNNWILILLTLLWVSIGSSMIIERIKQIIKYNLWIEKIN